MTLGVLARAARRYPVKVHAFVFLSNHYHLLLTVADAQRLAAFMNYVNSNLAREAGRLVHWREKFWGRRYQAILVSSEEPAQVARLRYLLAHGAKEGLVASPIEWPGAHCVRALLSGEAVVGPWIDRTLEYKARRQRLPDSSEAFVQWEELKLAPLPCWRQLEEEQYRLEIHQLVREIEIAVRRELESNGKRPLGRDAVLRQDPNHEPDRTKRGPAPLVHAATRAARDAIRDAYRVFWAGYRRAAERLRSGYLDALFPDGSFPPPLPFRHPLPSG